MSDPKYVYEVRYHEPYEDSGTTCIVYDSFTGAEEEMYEIADKEGLNYNGGMSMDNEYGTYVINTIEIISSLSEKREAMERRYKS